MNLDDSTLVTIGLVVPLTTGRMPDIASSSKKKKTGLMNFF